MDNSNIENLKLPQTVVARLIKEALPPGVNVSKEVKVAIARSAAIFVLHTTNYANESAKDHKRKNITAADVLSAIKILECEELEQPIVDALQLFKAQKGQRLEQRKRRQTADADAAASTVSQSSTPSKQSKRSTARDSTIDDESEGGVERQSALGSENTHEGDKSGEMRDEDTVHPIDDEMDSQRPFL